MAKQVVVVPGVDTLHTYVSPKSGAVFAVLANGTRYVKTITARQWKLFGQRKADLTLEQWTASKVAFYDALPQWAKGISACPTIATLERWSNDGVAMTPDGQRIEPDGTAANGAPSWLLLVGVI